jgi:hypothetical protein
MPRVQNFVCDTTGFLCVRLNKIRLVVLDYGQSGFLLTGDPTDGWGHFQGLGSFETLSTPCMESTVAYKLTHSVNTAFDGVKLRYAYSGLYGSVEQEWHFSPDPDWAVPGQTHSLGVVTVPQREIFFDYVSSMRYPAARDITMNIKVQINESGTPGQESIFHVAFRKGTDQLWYSCVLGRFAPGRYELMFLISGSSLTHMGKASSSLPAIR